MRGEQAGRNEAGERRQQHRLAPEAIGERPIDELAQPEPGNVNGDDPLPRIGVRDADIAPDRRQRGQHQVDTQGVHRHDRRHEGDEFSRMDARMWAWQGSHPRPVRGMGLRMPARHWRKIALYRSAAANNSSSAPTIASSAQPGFSRAPITWNVRCAPASFDAI